MREIIIDETSFSSAADVHSFLARELGFPSYYGSNLDALNDCLGDVDEPTSLSVYLAGGPLEVDAQDLWFAKIVRSLLRCARSNECLEVFVHGDALNAFRRLCEVPGLADMLDDDAFIMQGVIACLHG